MPSLTRPASITTTRAYDAFLKSLYGGAKRRPAELRVPPVKVIAVTGNEPPKSKQFQDAINSLYGIAYTIKMGIKFGKIPRPPGYFDFKVGALEALWWSTGATLDIADAKTLRWQAHLLMPNFVTAKLVTVARATVSAKHPDVPCDRVALTTVKEGRVVQMLHVGPYDKEEPTLDAMHAYMHERGLTVAGHHHEIYLSDPRRTAPAKLRTVLRLPVKPSW